MMAVKLGELRDTGHLSFSDGYRTKQSELATEGFRIVRAGDINDGGLALRSLDFVEASREPQIGMKAVCQGDVAITTKGTIGRVVRVNEPLDEPAVWSPQICFFRFHATDIIDRDYFSFWLSSPEAKAQIRAVSESTDMAPYLNLRDLSNLQLSLPPIEKQRAIGQILGLFDDKIATNRRSVEMQDRLRHALWQRNLKDGAVPKPLSSLASFVNGGAFTKGATGTGRVVVRIAEMTGGLGNSTVRNALDVPENQVVRNGDLLFSWSGTLMVKRWPHDEAIVNQHIFKVIPGRDFPAAFLDCVIEQQLDFFRMIAAGKATTMGHIKRSDLDASVHIPTRFRDNDLCLTESLWANATALEIENLTLAKTRDELLPLLMSGKITVKEAGQEAVAAGAHTPSQEHEA